MCILLELLVLLLKPLFIILNAIIVHLFPFLLLVIDLVFNLPELLINL